MTSKLQHSTADGSESQTEALNDQESAILCTVTVHVKPAEPCTNGRGITFFTLNRLFPHPGSAISSAPLSGVPLFWTIENASSKTFYNLPKIDSKNCTKRANREEKTWTAETRSRRIETCSSPSRWAEYIDKLRGWLNLGSICRDGVAILRVCWTVVNREPC